MFFGSKKPEVNKKEDISSKDLALINQMNNDLAGSLDLKETLQNALELIIKRINAQAANVFLFKQWITPIHSPETNKGEHKTE